MNNFLQCKFDLPMGFVANISEYDILFYDLISMDTVNGSNNEIHWEFFSSIMNVFITWFNCSLHAVRYDWKILF